MQCIKIYRLRNNGDQTLIATCRLEGEVVECQGEEFFISQLEREGIRDYLHRDKTENLYPKDGLRFLQNLQYAFRSGYLMATAVQEEDDTAEN